MVLVWARRVWATWSASRLRTILKCLLLGSLLIAALATLAYVAALLSYSLFYLLYVPKPMHEWPLYLDYSDAAADTLPRPPPRTYLFLGETPDVDRVFANNQGYDFFVEFVAPDSPGNRGCGVFMVSLKLASGLTEVELLSGMERYPTQFVPSGHSGAVGLARPAYFAYSSWPVRYLRKAILLVPFAFGWWSETTDFAVPLFANLFDNRTAPFRFAAVSVSNPALQIYQARLVARAHMTGLTYFMYTWFFSSFVLGVNFLASIYFTGLLLLAGYIFFRIYQEQLDATPAAPAEPPQDPVVTEILRPRPDQRAYLGNHPDFEFQRDLSMFAYRAEAAPPVGQPAAPVAAAAAAAQTEVSADPRRADPQTSESLSSDEEDALYSPPSSSATELRRRQRPPSS
eukprot:m.63786 g.63786  ORF g.63786 m.63786 type:complete len:400 (-) comp49676_c0_seq2:613-1812(-)